jgi:hypothetical protein
MKRALVVSGGIFQVESALGALGSAGFEAVVAESLTELRTQVEAGTVAAVVGYAGNAGDGEHLAAIAALPSMLRRSVVVALVGPELTTKDGVRAFLLGVELLVATADLPRLGELLGTALAAKRALVVLLDPAMAARLGG